MQYLKSLRPKMQNKSLKNLFFKNNLKNLEENANGEHSPESTTPQMLRAMHELFRF